MSDEPFMSVAPIGEKLFAGQTTIERGDVFTMYERPRLSLWQRLAVRVGLRPEPEPVLRTYIVSQVVSSS